MKEKHKVLVNPDCLGYILRGSKIPGCVAKLGYRVSLRRIRSRVRIPPHSIKPAIQQVFLYSESASKCCKELNYSSCA